MYASDHPHSECQFPNSVDEVWAGGGGMTAAAIRLRPEAAKTGRGRIAILELD